MSNDLTITISGPQGGGKTVLVAAILRLLHDAGVACTGKAHDGYQIDPSRNLLAALDHISYLPVGTKVVIKEVLIDTEAAGA